MDTDSVAGCSLVCLIMLDTVQAGASPCTAAGTSSRARLSCTAVGLAKCGAADGTKFPVPHRHSAMESCHVNSEKDQ